MSELLIRVPGEDLEYLETRSKKEKIPKVSLAGKLLHEKIAEERIKEAINMHVRGIFLLVRRLNMQESL